MSKSLKGASLSVSPTSVAFTAQSPNSPTHQTINLANDGSSHLTVQSISVQGSSAFSVSNSALPTSLQPGQSISLTLAFNPSTIGSFSGSLVIATNSGYSLTVPLTGSVAQATAVTISPTNASVQDAHSQQFTATVTGTSNTGVTWSVNGVLNGNASYGTISSAGLYTAPASVPAGAVVSVKAQSVADTTKSASASVTVVAASQTVTVAVSPNSASVQTNVTQQFTAAVTGTSNTGVIWSVNGVQGGNSTYGTISPGGLYTAPASIPSGGSVTVTANSLADTSKSASASVTVVATPQPVAVTISPSSATLQSKLTQQFTATVTGTSNTGVTWFVNGVQNGNATYGVITSTGLYTAPASVPSGGVVSVTARSVADSSKSASASVTLVASPQTVGVTISPTSASVQGSLTQQFTATVSGTTNTAVNWLVHGSVGGNSTYGTISSNGLYTAPACPSVSSVTVTAQSSYDSTASANATISLSAAPASSSNHYVATSGSDSNDGSACHPWATIGHATSLMNPGDTIYVADGTYYENLLLTRSGTATAPIVIKSQNKWGAKVAATSGVNLHYFSGAQYVTLQDFEITGSPSSNGTIKMDSGSHNSVIGNKIHDNAVSTTTCLSGGAVVSATDYSTISGNLIYNVGPPRSAPRCNQNHGIYINGGSSGTVTNNLIMEVWQGLAIHMAGINLSHWTIADNTVVNSGTNVTGSGTSSGGAETLYCEGGTCDYNTYSNNIFAFTQGGYCFREENAGGTVGSHNQYLNNLLYDCGSNLMLAGTPQNTVISDPKFVNYTGDQTGDYHLQVGSPAINSGTMIGSPAIDFDGTSRPQGGAFDIGAFEYIP